MTTVRELHDKAMILAQSAYVARQTGNIAKAEQLARDAWKLEEQAAALVPKDRSSEPTRSILYRSAASLAYQSKDFRKAQELINYGLEGFPPPDVEQELRSLLQQVNFEHHLQTRGLSVDDEELEISMKGNAVGFGTIVYDECIKRLEAFRSLLDRTAQRKMERTYQRSGKVAQRDKLVTPILAATREGSFIISIQFGRSEGKQLGLFVNTKIVLDEIMTGLELINEHREEELRSMISDDSYLNHFLSMAREIAPDGDKITSIQFIERKDQREIELTRKRDNIMLSTDLDILVRDRNFQSVSIKGRLDYAESRKKNVIGLTQEDGKRYKIIVKEGMDDLVRTYFGLFVTITGVSDGKVIYPSDIREAEE